MPANHIKINEQGKKYSPPIYLHLQLSLLLMLTTKNCGRSPVGQNVGAGGGCGIIRGCDTTNSIRFPQRLARP
jgi:hypothetical protein